MARPLQITDDTIVKALAAGGEVTAGNLADRLGMGQSTAAKRLAALEAAGGVRRTPGGRVNGVRAADRWSSVAAAADSAEPVVPDTDVSATREMAPVEAEPAGPGGSGRLGRGAPGTLVRDYLATRPGEAFGPSAVGKALGRSQGAVSNLCGSSVSSATVAEVSEAVGISRSAASKVLADLEREGQVSRVSGGQGEGGRRLPDRWSTSASSQPTPDDGTARLGRGQLRNLVVEHLRAHPGEVSPAQLSTLLGRSAGAISNALVKLVDVGDVVLTNEHPRRYSARPAVR